MRSISFNSKKGQRLLKTKGFLQIFYRFFLKTRGLLQSVYKLFGTDIPLSSRGPKGKKWDAESAWNETGNTKIENQFCKNHHMHF